jgi:hypothetical protein
MIGKMKKAAVVALAVVAVCVLLLAPVVFVVLVLDHAPLAAAAAEYEGDATCAATARAAVQSPTHPIPDALRNGTPCAITGAIVAEKDTLSGGATGAAHYALGLRSDSGNDSVVTLDGGKAQEFWNEVQGGDRVLIQTLRGQVTLVGDGYRTVPTGSTPAVQSQSNALGLWLAGSMCALEFIALGIFVALRRRGATAPEEPRTDI